MGQKTQDKAQETAQLENKIIKEMMPFAVYAALPIILTVIIAFTFGTR